MTCPYPRLHRARVLRPPQLSPSGWHPLSGPSPPRAASDHRLTTRPRPSSFFLLPSQRLQQFRSSPSATYPEDRHGHHFDVHVQAPLEDVDAQSRGYRADLTHESAQVSVPIPRSRDTARGHRICHSAAGLASTTPAALADGHVRCTGNDAGVTPLPVAMDSYRCCPRNFLNAANGDAATAPSPRIPPIRKCRPRQRHTHHLSAASSSPPSPAPRSPSLPGPVLCQTSPHTPFLVLVSRPISKWGYYPAPPNFAMSSHISSLAAEGGVSDHNNGLVGILMHAPGVGRELAGNVHCLRMVAQGSKARLGG
ncbi:hypothetical protein B0H10DRAFT_2450268 [Mycena sp. CBHHK59/15]|nr:hypothetical protein B0H10DRAFT_2450268 [Mycena sp. CBHHK59/15]